MMVSAAALGAVSGCTLLHRLATTSLTKTKGQYLPDAGPNFYEGAEQIESNRRDYSHEFCKEISYRMLLCKDVHRL